MPKSIQTPSEALALGTLAELLDGQRARRTAFPGVRRVGPDGTFAAPATNAQDHALTEVLATAAQEEGFRRQGRQARLLEGGSAREVAQHNAERAQATLARSRLAARVDELRRRQAQAPTPALARGFRRQRAETVVQMDALTAELAQQDAKLAAARARLLAAGQARVQADKKRRQVAERLVFLRAQQAPLTQAFLALDEALGLAACRLFLAQQGPLRAGTEPAQGLAVGDYRRRLQAVAEELAALHEQVGQGRYARAEVEPLQAGRALATGEVLAAYVALGETHEAAALFAALCPKEQFLHPIYAVFRSYSFGLYACQDFAALFHAARLHRYDDGPLGALAEAWCCLLHPAGDDFARALTRFAQQDWRAWWHTQTPGMGFVSTATCALARLGRAHKLVLPPALGPTAPPVLWAGA